MWVRSNHEGVTMMTQAKINPSDACEAILQQIKSYNAQHKIWPAQKAIIERLIARRIELTEAYAELHEKLGTRFQALEVFFDLLIGAVDGWNPKSNAQARAQRQRLNALNKDIADKAADLARLLQERSDLNNRSGFSSNTFYHPIDLVEKAASENGRYNSFLKEPIARLRGQYDLKYWPSISQCLRALSCDARHSIIQANDPFTHVATKATRGSLADFFKALFVAIEESGVHQGGFLPSGFSVTDATFASLTNCALDLKPDEMVDAVYVKRLRQRERERMAVVPMDT